MRWEEKEEGGEESERARTMRSQHGGGDEAPPLPDTWDNINNGEMINKLITS